MVFDHTTKFSTPLTVKPSKAFENFIQTLNLDDLIFAKYEVWQRLILKKLDTSEEVCVRFPQPKISERKLVPLNKDMAIWVRKLDFAQFVVSPGNYKVSLELLPASDNDIAKYGDIVSRTLEATVFSKDLQSQRYLEYIFQEFIEANVDHDNHNQFFQK